MKIENKSDKARYCADKLLQPGEIITVDDAKYLESVRLSPETFEVVDEKEPLKKEKQKPIKKKTYGVEE